MKGVFRFGRRAFSHGKTKEKKEEEKRMVYWSWVGWIWDEMGWMASYRGRYDN